MHLPKEVKVGGFWYKVLYPYVFTEREDVRAMLDPTRHEFRFGAMDSGGDKYPEESLTESLIHELLHCIDIIYNNDALGESAIERLSQGLYQVLTDNFVLSEKKK